jgi:hypothetical protein
MQKYEYLINPQIARIESSSSVIPKFSLGANLDLYSGPGPYRSSKINISFEVIKDLVEPNQYTQKFSYFSGSEGKDEVFYSKSIGLGIKLKLHLKNLMGDTRLTVNRGYHKYVRMKVDSVYPPGAHLADILTVNLLKRKYMPLHCAAFSNKQNEGVLLVAPPDTGKTLTTLLALKKGFSYLAEDIAVVDQEHVYANPYTSTFLHNDEFGNHKANSHFFSLSKKIPLLSAYVRPKVSISSIMKDFKIEEKANIKNIFVLERGTSGIEKIEPREATRRILIINRNEFSYHKNPLLFAYSYFNPFLDINELMRTEEDLIYSIVEKTDCSLLKANKPTEYIDLLLGALKS